VLDLCKSFNQIDVSTMLDTVQKQRSDWWITSEEDLQGPVLDSLEVMIHNTRISEHD
jgi:hypothetical protein